MHRRGCFESYRREKISKECRSTRRGIHIKHVVFGWSGRILRDRCWLKLYLSLWMCEEGQHMSIELFFLVFFFMKRQRASKWERSYVLFASFYIFFIYLLLCIEKWQWDPLPLSLRQHIIHFRFHFIFLLT